MTHDDTTLQAAIDAAFHSNGDKHGGTLVTSKCHIAWPRESTARLAVAKAFLAALPPAEQSALDERSLGQVAFEAFGYTHSWDVSTRQKDWQRAAQSVVEAIRGKQHAEIEKLKAELTQTKKHLVDANRGAQRNAYINQSLATKLNEALKRAEKTEADSVPRPSLSRLRPLTEAGPVPDGAVRFTGYLDMPDVWVIGSNCSMGEDTHFADIILPTSEAEQKADPYAELKAAHAARKVIQTKWTNHGWKDNPSPDWTLPPDRYRIKPEPETNEASARGGSLPRLVRPRLNGTRCATCGGKLKLWIAEGVTGVVCCNGCVSLNYVPAAVRRSRERYNDFLRTDSGMSFREWLRSRTNNDSATTH